MRDLVNIREVFVMKTKKRFNKVTIRTKNNNVQIKTTMLKNKLSINFYIQRVLLKPFDYIIEKCNKCSPNKKKGNQLEWYVTITHKNFLKRER